MVALSFAIAMSAAPTSSPSLAERLAALPESDRIEVVAAMPPSDRAALKRAWPVWARPEQLPPAWNWRTWLFLAGRGAGKTRAAAEQVRAWAESGTVRRMTLAGATADDMRDIMIEGESGILAVSRPNFRPVYEPSKRRLTWPNGCRALLLSADEPDRFRGKQHEKAWADELAAWRHPEAWTQLLFGLRIGQNPQAIVTTTPRPTPLIKRLLADRSTATSRGSTYDNRANLAPGFLADIVSRYEGTRIGRQELHAEILDDVPGALWNADKIDALRTKEHPDLERVVVAIDPAVSANEKSDETGIIVAGIGLCGCRGEQERHGFVLADLSGRKSPNEWATLAIKALADHKGDRLVAEVNNGGDLVEANLRTVDRNVPYRAVHASRGKRTRAEPIAALYEQGKVHHVGPLPHLEDQLTTWDPLASERSPDRMDALVWALTELMLGEEKKPFFIV